MRSGAEGAPSYVYVPGLAQAPGEVELGGDEARYLCRVVRVRPGESVTASDGAGTVAELRVLDTGAAVRAEVRNLRRVERATELTVWCGAPEGDRADWLVEKLAELGVAAVQPVDAERGRWERAGARAARWGRLAVAALRQSRSAHLLRVLPPAGLGPLLEAGPPRGGAWLADPAGAPFRAPPAGGARFGVAAIGPSGGFSDGELKRLAQGGFVAVQLTGSRLRTETAAVALATLVLALGGGSGAPGPAQPAGPEP